jgi:hypothetical protein
MICCAGPFFFLPLEAVPLPTFNLDLWGCYEMRAVR